MGQYKQNSNGKGSLKDIQILINQAPQVLESAIIDRLQLPNTNFEWLSPLINDDYKEYRDVDFLKRLSINSLDHPLKQFWPSLGPQWDGLGKLGENIFLIEAKANIPEILSPPTSAKSETSLKLIQDSLNEVKEFIGSNSSADWSKKFYQYTNRLAHLYFLRKLNKIPTYLIFIYFIGDKTVDGPNTVEEWLGALKLMKQYLGIDKTHKLSPYILDVFIEVKDLP